MSLHEALRLSDLDRLVPVSGGDINEAFRVELSDGSRLFAKTHASPPAGMFEAEAAGLAALRDASDGRLLVPEVVSVGPSHLALEWMGDRGGDAASGPAAERLGRGLAHIHQQSHPRGFGFAEDNWIGTLPQPNAWVAKESGASTFFAERRLLPQLELATSSRVLPVGAAARVEAVCARLDDLLPEEPSGLIHGDLWGGNWTTDHAGRPWIFDPAVAFAPREQELAFTQLFGGFPASFYAAYREVWPLAPGFAERVDLWNLYPLLVHANLFGGSYGTQVDRIARRYAPV
ncbi:MAG: fructosamine kinase family protein [Deltaproteobacteria bacterium]|nr:fructosamine kinase family protein [Deltaproteobacteria bacterium]